MIVLAEEIALRDGCPVSVEIVPMPLSPEDDARGWDQLTPEEIADLERHLTECQGFPFKLEDEEP